MTKLKHHLGAMVMGHSLKDRGASARLVVLATLDNLSPSAITELKACLMHGASYRLLTHLDLDCVRRNNPYQPHREPAPRKSLPHGSSRPDIHIH